MIVNDSSKAVIEIPTSNFSFSECLAYLNRNLNECLHKVETDRVKKVILLGKNPILIEIRASKEGLIVAYEPAEKDHEEEIILYVKEWFDLDRDLKPFHVLAGKDPILASIVQSFPGLRIIRIPNLFEAFCWAIIGQQINLSFAYKLKRRLVETYGRQLEFDNEKYYFFPLPEQLAQLEESDLRPLQFSRPKAKYLILIAQAFLEGHIKKDSLINEPDKGHILSLLTQWKGIGHWSAQYISLRGLGNPFAFPIGDVGLQNALKIALQRSEKPSIPEIQAIAKRWKGWEAYATFYLWRSLIQ